MPLSVFRVQPVGQPVSTVVPPAIPPPGYGPVQGMQLVEVFGDGFVVSPDGVPRVRVFFGLSEASEIDPGVISTSTIRLLTPPTRISTSFNENGDVVADGSGLVDVRVDVLDDSGAVIDTTTLVDGYEFRRERLDDEVPDVLDVVTAQLALQLRRDYLPRVLLSDKAIDYVAPDAQLPYMTLVGPVEEQNDLYQTRSSTVINGVDQLVGPISSRLLSRSGRFVDVVFGVEVYAGTDEGGKPTILKLKKRLISLLKDRPFLTLYRVCGDPTSGEFAKHRLVWSPGTEATVPRDVANNSGLRLFTMSIRVVGVDLRAGTIEGMGVLDVVSSLQTIDISGC